jgi:hypothetical protein
VTAAEFIQPRTPQKDWTMKQNMGLLKVRGLCALVEKCMNQVGGPPPIKKYIGGNVVNIEHMLERFSIMMAACRQNEYCKRDIHLLDFKIKVFLFAFARFDDGMKSRNDAVYGVSPSNRPSEKYSSHDDKAVIIYAMDNDI